MWSVLYLCQLFLYLLMGRLFLTDFPGKLIQLIYPVQVIDHAGDPACLGTGPEISSIYGGNDTGGDGKYICTKRLAVIAAAAVILVMVLLIIETFRLLLPGLWTAFSSGDEQALSDYLTSEGRLRSFLTLWFLAFVQVVSLVIPAMPVQLAAGIAYGPWKGFVTSFSASVAANFLVFLLARRLAKVIELLTANSPKANKLLNSVRNSKNPWFYTILAFITPGLPNGIIPYAAAHANMKPKQFFAAVCISMPIPTLLTCLAGSYLVTGDWLFTVLIEGGMFAVVGLLFHKRSAVIGHAHEVKDRHTR